MYINPIELYIESTLFILHKCKHILFQFDNILHEVSFVLNQSMMYYTDLPLYVGYFRLFSAATSSPSERRPQKTVSCYGDSARIQDESTESSA